MSRKKHVGTKGRIMAEKERERRTVTAIFLALILFGVAFIVHYTYTVLNPSSDLSLIEPTVQFRPENPKPELKAAIVDQLSLTVPDQEFLQTAVGILEQANYSIDYYAGESVTVGLYRYLPKLDYRIVLLRVHSAGQTIGGSEKLQLFTSELYGNNKHVVEQLAGQLGMVKYSWEDKTAYFGITHTFVEQCMNSRFKNTVVIAMGCDGLAGTQMARAYIEKGAKAYVGWNGSVSASHTDQVTAQLLRHLVSEGQTVKQAVESTMEEVGPDPAYSNALQYYPLASGNYAIQGQSSPSGL